MESTCAKCGHPIADAATGGRPKKFCSSACRRAAEFEIRRANTLLAKLEERLSNARLGYGVWEPSAVAELESEIARQESRLLALLEDGL